MIINSNILPRPIPALKLALTGATVGPLVDSLHNQCLLEYQKAMIDIPAVAPLTPQGGASSLPDIMIQQSDHLFYLIRTSWYVPPLLGVAYLVLGAILPRIISRLLASTVGAQDDGGTSISSILASSPSVTMSSKAKAILAVSTTALIIKLSEILETVSFFESEINNEILFATALIQWFLLDCTISSLITATIVSVGGPLSELPFVANGFWRYLPQASDYYPLKDVNWDVLIWLLGDDYQELALSSITAPCYFAVTMDAIALARWFSMDGNTSSIDGMKNESV